MPRAVLLHKTNKNPRFIRSTYFYAAVEVFSDDLKGLYYNLKFLGICLDLNAHTQS